MEDIIAGSDGVWEVFHAPHIARLSNPLGVHFRPVRYTIDQGKAVQVDIISLTPRVESVWFQLVESTIPFEPSISKYQSAPTTPRARMHINGIDPQDLNAKNVDSVGRCKLDPGLKAHGFKS